MYKPVLAFLVAMQMASVASAKDFALATLKQASHPDFDMTGKNKGDAFYKLVHDSIAPAMEEAGADGGSKTNVTKLKAGQGVSVKLGEHNYNVHINFPRSEQGGRSYGWTSGKVGDWSDSMYLENLGSVMDDQNTTEIRKLYTVIIKMLGSSDPAGLEQLKPASQRVVTNFLAIYTAEEYRRIQKSTTHWDDALMQVTLLGAFHGGQETFEMFYTGDFTDTVKEKGPGVYQNGRPGPIASDANDKDADMTDYHQFSGKTPDQQGSNRSGINLTRKDFEKMGEAITTAEKKNANLKKIESIIKGDGDNVYADLADYFAAGRAKAKDADALAKAVADFQIDVFNDADKISKSLEK
jgi:hypothetical protein